MVATRLSTGEVKEVVRIFSSDSSIVEENKETLLQLIEKHLRTHPDRQLSEPPGDDGSNNGICPVVTREVVRLAIR